MDQSPLFFERIEDALREVIRAVGGPKKVAALLWPDKLPRDAHNLLDACLNHERREKFSPNKLLMLLRLGREAGCHSAMHFVAGECGYAAPAPRTSVEEEQQLTDVIAQSAIVLDRALARLEGLRARPVVGTSIHAVPR